MSDSEELPGTRTLKVVELNHAGRMEVRYVAKAAWSSRKWGLFFQQQEERLAWDENRPARRLIGWHAVDDEGTVILSYLSDWGMQQSPLPDKHFFL